MKSIAHPDMREEFPAGSDTNSSRLRKSVRMMSGSGSSAWGIAVLSLMLRVVSMRLCSRFDNR